MEQLELNKPVVETEILCNENEPSLQSWCKRPFGSKKSNMYELEFQGPMGPLF